MIPDIQAGYFEDVTQKIGRVGVSLESNDWTKRFERRREPRHLQLPESRILEGTFTLPQLDKA